MTSSGTAFLESKKLLGAESLVMDLTGGLDQVLKVCASQEVSQINKLAMVLVFDVDDTPTILTSSNLLAANNDGLFASHNRERDDVLDLGVDSSFFVIKFIIVVGVHLEVVESEFLLDALLESTAFLKCQTVCFGNHWNHVDNIGELLQNDDIDRLQCVTRWLNKEEAAMNSRILDVAFTLSGKLFS